MQYVKFSPPTNDPNWSAWIDEVTAETKKNLSLMRRNRRIAYKAKLYKKMRQVIFDGFYGKCAYCEAKFILTEMGDVEHYRPKGAITDELDQRVMIPRRGKRPKPHPGYYWLAYDWRNLLPSCSLCNRPSRPRGRVRIGKGTRFPVLPSPTLRYGHARCPDDLVKELPVFIHPAIEDPHEHIRLDPETGLLIDKTARGKLCIDLLGLNREALARERRKIYLLVRGLIKTSLQQIRARDLKSLTDQLEIIEAYKQGRESYSWAGQVALKAERAAMKELRRLANAL
ncbi:MAG TPA: hypothetical protein VEV42_07260 [Pyrinomonadaceae bacterium]|jgi:hypothetical protein|nr:hypothetical protein [Pyrinomonadaceae bacterium]